MSINVEIPACILPDIAQFIIYKKLLLRKNKMVSFAAKIMKEYNRNPIGKQKMELNDAISIVYSAVRAPEPDFLPSKQSQWYKILNKKYPYFYSKNFLYKLCQSIYKKLLINDELKYNLSVKDVLNGTWNAHCYIVEELYRISFSKEEKSILSFRRANKKTLAKVTVDSLTFGIIIKLTKEKQAMEK